MVKQTEYADIIIDETERDVLTLVQTYPISNHCEVIFIEREKIDDLIVQLQKAKKNGTVIS